MTVKQTKCTFPNAGMFKTFCTFTTNILSHLVLVYQRFLHSIPSFSLVTSLLIFFAVFNSFPLSLLFFSLVFTVSQAL